MVYHQENDANEDYNVKVVIAPTEVSTFDGIDLLMTSLPYQSWVIQSNGEGNWVIVGRY